MSKSFSWACIEDQWKKLRHRIEVANIFTRKHILILPTARWVGCVCGGGGVGGGAVSACAFGYKHVKYSWKRMNKFKFEMAISIYY